MHWHLIAALSQAAFTGWFALTHWVDLKPLNNLDAEAFPHERRTNLILHIFQLASIGGFLFQIFPLMWLGVVFWSVSMAGHIVSWWLPYFFGWPKAFLKNAEADNAKTHHFLPTRKNYPIPDLNHCILGLLLLVALISTWTAVI